MKKKPLFRGRGNGRVYICADCGNPILNKTRNAVYCAECSLRKEKKRKRESRKKLVKARK